VNKGRGKGTSLTFGIYWGGEKLKFQDLRNRSFYPLLHSKRKKGKNRKAGPSFKSRQEVKEREEDRVFAAQGETCVLVPLGTFAGLSMEDSLFLKKKGGRGNGEQAP